jgi:hypothetical protein
MSAVWTLCTTNERWAPEVAQWQSWRVSFRPQIHGGDHIDFEFVKAMEVGSPPQQPNADEEEDSVWEWESNVEGIDLVHSVQRIRLQESSRTGIEYKCGFKQSQCNSQQCIPLLTKLLPPAKQAPTWLTLDHDIMADKGSAYGANRASDTDFRKKWDKEEFAEKAKQKDLEERERMQENDERMKQGTTTSHTITQA